MCQCCWTYGNPNDVHEVERWDRSRKESITTKCPEVIKNYNKSLGGVDLCDVLIFQYRTNIKTNRWYIKIIFHCVDVSMVNLWNLYRRHFLQLRKPQISQMNLPQFSIGTAEGLKRAGRLIGITGRASER